MLKKNILLWLTFSLAMSAFFFSNMWTTKLIADVAKDNQLGLLAGIMVPLGGIVGALMYSLSATVVSQMKATMFILAGAAIVYSLYGFLLQNVTIAIALALAVGIFANGSICAFYSFSPTLYPAHIRATGVGIMIGIGRTVSIATPILVGYMLTTGLRPEDLYYFYSAALVASLIVMFPLNRLHSTP
jgi:MFS family permease